MNLPSRLFRRIIIAVVFLAVLGFLGLGFKKATTPVATCVDGAKNGQEEGIDCGLVACGISCEEELAPPKVKSSQLFKVGDNDYDFIAEIINPHDKYGSSEINYELTFFGKSGKEIFKKSGNFYLLPIQQIPLILTSLKTKEIVEKSEFKIKSAKWQKLESLEGVNFIVRREKLTIVDSNQTNSLEAVIFNDSDFDFGIVDIWILLLDSSNNTIGVNRTDIRTFFAGTERYFKVVWPFAINRRTAKTEIMVTANPFENANFVKRYGSPVEKFQKYD